MYIYRASLIGHLEVHLSSQTAAVCKEYLKAPLVGLRSNLATQGGMHHGVVATAVSAYLTMTLIRVQ